MSYGVPVIESRVSFGLNNACNVTFIACEPDTSWFLTSDASEPNILENICSIFSLPVSLYPYPFVPYRQSHKAQNQALRYQGQ